MSPEALKDVSQSHDQGGQHKPMMKVKLVYLTSRSNVCLYPEEIWQRY